MHGYWPFEYGLPSGPHRRVLVLFCSAARPEENDIAQCIVDYCDTKRPPDKIYLIAPQSEGLALGEILAARKFQDRVRDATQSVDTPKVEGLLFDFAGVTRDSQGKETSHEIIEPLKRLGLTSLMREHPVFLVAPPSHHFVVPSGRHAEGFFRIGSAMMDGAAIDFLAFCCLPFFVGRELKHIYCDTGAISPVAYAINALRSRLSPDSLPATVSSFSSYQGLPDFKFKEMEHSLILISISTSGGLAKGLCDAKFGIQSKDILTLFALHEPVGSAPVVCDLRKDSNNPDGFDAVVDHPERDCPLCDKGSTRIVISTDQFLPGRGKTESLIIRVTHSPKWLSKFLKQFVGTGVIRANYKSADTHHATSEVFFDLQAMFEANDMPGIEPFVTRLWRTVDRVVPARLTRILCLDD